MSVTGQSEMLHPMLARIRRIEIQHRWNVRKLAHKDSITVEDVLSADRLVRGAIACGHWARCDRTARHALLNDAHAHVRSTARISAEVAP